MKKALKIIAISLAVLCALGFSLLWETPRRIAIDLRAPFAHPAELYGYANFYQAGNIVRQDPQKAFHFAKLSAETGNALAQHRLGWYYSTGFGVAQNDAKAIAWYKKSAAQDLAKSHQNLASHYWERMHDAQYVKKAIAHDKRAGELGWDTSYYRLGVLYSEGAGANYFKELNKELQKSIMDHKTANYYFANAMKLGHADAARLLGDQTWKGRGMKADTVQASIYYFVSHKLGGTRNAFTYAMQFVTPEQERHILRAGNVFMMKLFCNAKLEIANFDVKTVCATDFRAMDELRKTEPAAYATILRGTSKLKIASR